MGLHEIDELSDGDIDYSDKEADVCSIRLERGLLAATDKESGIENEEVSDEGITQRPSKKELHHVLARWSPPRGTREISLGDLPSVYSEH